MSNTALSAIRAKVRRLLNEPTAGFWTDADINAFIQDALDKYYRVFTEQNPEYGRRYKDITYTASAEYYDIDTSSDGYTIESILDIEDRTNYQPGAMLMHATSLEQIQEVSFPLSASTYASYWYFEKIESASTGVYTITQRLYLGPKPGSARSLRLHIQCNPQTLSGDTYTTGLPDYVERCIVLAACIDAKLKETSPNIGAFQQMLKEAEWDMYKHALPIGRDSRNIDYDPKLFE